MARKLIVPLFAWLLLMLIGLAQQVHAAEPTVHDIYQAADSGDLPRAQQMVDQVIQAHPGSGKAHYVKAELAARGNDAATAQAELATADRLAPGLPFVKPEAASALRAQVDRMSATASAAPATPDVNDTRRMGAPPAMDRGPSQERSSGGFSLAPLLLIGLPLAAMLMLRRRRNTPNPNAGMSYGGNDGFGRGTPLRRNHRFGADQAPMQQPDMVYDRYGRPVMQPGDGYGQQPGMGGFGRSGGMGGAIARGLGAGVAMGAGAVAAQEIGRRMFDHGQDGRSLHQSGGAGDSQIARDAGLGGMDAGGNQDMGGQDFGIGGGGWEDAGDVGGDWNN